MSRNKLHFLLNGLSLRAETVLTAFLKKKNLFVQGSVSTTLILDKSAIVALKKTGLNFFNLLENVQPGGKKRDPLKGCKRL